MGFVYSTTIYLTRLQFVKICNGLRVILGAIFGDLATMRFPEFRGFDIFIYLFFQVSWRLEGHLNITKNICWSDLLSLRRSLVKQIPRKELDWVGG